MEVENRSYKNIFVVCPAYTKTGGSELLHQLVFELVKLGFNAQIAYFRYEEGNKNYTPKDFIKYVSNFTLFENIYDSKDTLIVFYEGVVHLLKEKPNSSKVMWWLSVDNYTRLYGIEQVKLRRNKLVPLLRYIRLRNWRYNVSNVHKQVILHMSQSYYSINYLNKHGIKNVEFLSDYISEEYLSVTDKDYNNKKDIVVYNPKKGYKYTQQLIEKYPDITWTPIENLTTDGVKKLLLSAKVYIDFGFHPGKDRIPREAAMAGCCVITDKKGSAAFFEDVPIGAEFKFEDKTENIPSIHKKIVECLDNYDQELLKFQNYRNYIREEKAKFEEDVNRIFKDKMK